MRTIYNHDNKLNKLMYMVIRIQIHSPQQQQPGSMEGHNCIEQSNQQLTQKSITHINIHKQLPNNHNIV